MTNRGQTARLIKVKKKNEKTKERLLKVKSDLQKKFPNAKVKK
jgi:hypothetical protein